MPEALQDPFANAIWNALQTSHHALALTRGLAWKYPHDIAPFAAVEQNTSAAFEDLRSLMQPGEHVWLFHDEPLAVAGLSTEANLPCLQMAFPQDGSLPSAAGDEAILPISCDQSAEMVALTDIAFPGFFRSRTCRMGAYFCIRDESHKMIAMGGERLVLDINGENWRQREQWREISGICTHPDHRGHGYATQLIVRLLEDHRRAGAISCLHVASSNTNAIALYHQLGFNTLREIQLYKVLRTE